MEKNNMVTLLTSQEEDYLDAVFDDMLAGIGRGYRVFNTKLTDTILRNGSDLKISKEANNWFSSCISSIAEEMMEIMIGYTTKIDVEHIRYACEKLDLSDCFQTTGDYVSISRLLRKYRQLQYFKITLKARGVLKTTLHTIMKTLAKNIHDSRVDKDRTTIYTDDVTLITDAIVFVRSYSINHVLSRVRVAQQRKRKSNGRFS